MARLPRRFRRRPDTGAIEIQFKHEGRRYRRSYPAAMEPAEAFRLGRLFRAAVLGGATVQDCTGLQTIAALEIWLEKGATVRRCEASLSNAKSRVRAIEPWVRGVPLAGLTSGLIREMRVGLDGRYRPWYVYGVLSDLRSALRYAVETGDLERSPFPAKVMPRIPERAPDRLSDELVGRLLADVHRQPRYWFFELMLLTGLRWCEMRSLEARHVAWKPHAHLVVETSKNGRVRRIPLVGRAKDLLRPRCRDHVGRLVPYSSNAGSLVRRCSDWSWHVHQLRHTFACRYVEAGGSLAALKELLGHSSITTTMIYGRASDDLVRSDMARVEGHLVPRAGTTAHNDGVIDVVATADSIHSCDGAAEEAS